MWPPQRNMMWPPGQPQPRVPPPTNNYYGYQQQPPLLPDPNWQDLMLEQQFSHMNFRQPPPLVFHQQRQQQPRANNANLNPSGIPSLLDIRVPRPPHLNGRMMRPPRNNFPMINTSVPPPRIAILQKPPRTQPPPVVLAQRPPIIAPKVEPKPIILAEEAPFEESLVNGGSPVKDEPEIRVKTILKRPASTPSNLASASNDAPAEDSDPVENLKKREEEYAKARLRILGSTGHEESNEVNSHSS